VIERLVVTPYRLPLRRTWRSARGPSRERVGWLVCAHADGLRGYGDCAPLPQAGTEGPEAALAALGDWQARAVGRPLETLIEDMAATRTRTPAAGYALECALLDLAAQRTGLPLRRWLSPAAGDSLEVNAALGALRNLSAEGIRAACTSGFRVLKVKVGLQDVSNELTRLKAVAHRLPPGTSLRLDANGAWGPEKAMGMVEALNALPVEALEEPLREPRAGDLERLQSAAVFPIALDESLYRSATPVDLETLPVHRIVLKPAVVGGLRRTQDLAIRAAGLGIEVVLTSLIESAAGIWPTAQLAAAVPSCQAHGLATSDWLALDLGAPPSTATGRIALGEHPGSGFRPDGAPPPP